MNQRWRDIDAPNVLQTLLEESESRPVVIYKHSTLCSASGISWHEVLRYLDTHDNDIASFYRVTVQKAQELSRAIAELLDVEHHTPQLIVIRKGVAVHVASHWNIRRQTLHRALTEI